MMFGPPMRSNMEKYKEPKPKNIREVPSYLKKVIGGFFFRLFYIFKLVWETNPFILFLMMFVSVFNGVMPILGAYITKELTNSLISAYNISIGNTTGINFNSAFKAVMILLIFQFAYLFAIKLVSGVNIAITRVTGELVVNHIKVKIINKAKDIDVAKFDIPEFYEQLENASREADRRPIQIMEAVFNIISTVISMVSFIAILWFVSPVAPVIIIAMSLPSAFVNFHFRKKHVNYMRFRSRDRREMNYFADLVTNKDMVKEVRLFNLGDSFIDKFKTIFKRYFKGLKALIIKEQSVHLILNILTTTVNCILFLYVAYKVCMGQLTVGDYSLYTGALNSISSGVTSLIGTTATIYEGTLFINNMIEFMKVKKEIVPNIDKPLSVNRHCEHTIELKNVSFKYPGTETYVLKNINLFIRPGETLVLVGLNGAGKTTLIKLLTRLYDPTEGVILLDGRDIKSYNVDEVYKMFGIIFQDFGKYAVSVEENISYGDIEKTIDRSDIIRAAKESGADEFVTRLKNSYDTPLMRIFEETGTELSGGQWQKLAVARAFYSDSDILILDEPTASLDAIAEQEVFSQFDRLRKDKITLFVSHRLSSATVASKIIVLSNGEIIEEGNHEELLAKRGIYHKLFTTQAKRYFESVKEEDFKPIKQHNERV